MLTGTELVQKAKEYATQAHAGQFLRNTAGEPFISHPGRVVALVEASGASDIEIAAAWLHDIVEDTSVTIEDIRKEFGDTVTELVDGLTDPPHFEGNHIQIRKQWQAERIRAKSESVKRIKIADQTVNVTMMGNDPPVGWTPEDRLLYVEGAKSIVNECVGLNSFLDDAFEKAFKTTVQIITSAELPAR